MDRNLSYWLDSTSRPAYPALEEDIEADVAIVGGGIAGINCGYFLSQENMKVVIVEADRILQGTTGHTTAKVTSQHSLIYARHNAGWYHHRDRFYDFRRLQ